MKEYLRKSIVIETNHECGKIILQRIKAQEGTMVNVLLLPFMCLSLTQEAAKSEAQPYSVNEITSMSLDSKYVNGEYEKSWKQIRSSSKIYSIIHNEGSEHHTKRESAENIYIPDGDDRDAYRDIELRGKTSSKNQLDVYSFFVKDRMTCHIKFNSWSIHMTGKIFDEQGVFLFEFTDDDEMYGPTELLKKGIYFLYIETEDKYDTNYVATISLKYADSTEKVTIDDEMMSKYKALVWESDYVPGGVGPIDGKIVKQIIQGRSTPRYTTGGFYSCKEDEHFLYRSIYIWSEDAFESLRRDVEKYREMANDVLAKNNKIITSLSWSSTALSGMGLIVSFLPIIGTTIGMAVSVLSLETSLIAMTIGDGTELNYDLIKNQCSRIIGSLDSAIDGTVLSIKESAYIKSYKNDVSSVSSIQTYKLKFSPYVSQLGIDHCVVDRKANKPYPTYDAWLHFGGDKEIVNDCQGTFKTYRDFRDIKPLINTEELS